MMIFKPFLRFTAPFGPMIIVTRVDVTLQGVNNLFYDIRGVFIAIL